jgi:hypothetical protein
MWISDLVKCEVRRTGFSDHGVGSPKSSSVAGAEEEGEPVQIRAESAGAVGGVADEGGEAAGEGLLVAAG